MKDFDDFCKQAVSLSDSPISVRLLNGTVDGGLQIWRESGDSDRHYVHFSEKGNNWDDGGGVWIFGLDLYGMYRLGSAMLDYAVQELEKEASRIKASRQFKPGDWVECSYYANEKPRRGQITNWQAPLKDGWFLVQFHGQDKREFWEATYLKLAQPPDDPVDSGTIKVNGNLLNLAGLGK
jgi:hypothetical protein